MSAKIPQKMNEQLPRSLRPHSLAFLCDRENPLPHPTPIGWAKVNPRLTELFFVTHLTDFQYGSPYAYFGTVKPHYNEI